MGKPTGEAIDPAAVATEAGSTTSIRDDRQVLRDRLSDELIEDIRERLTVVTLKGDDFRRKATKANEIHDRFRQDADRAVMNLQEEDFPDRGKPRYSEAQRAFIKDVSAAVYAARPDMVNLPQFDQPYAHAYHLFAQLGRTGVITLEEINELKVTFQSTNITFAARLLGGHETFVRRVKGLTEGYKPTGRSNKTEVDSLLSAADKTSEKYASIKEEVTRANLEAQIKLAEIALLLERSEKEKIVSVR